MFLTPPERVADHVARGWWEGTTVDALFQRTAAAGGDALALVDPPNRALLDGITPGRLSWKTLVDRVERTAAAFLALGLAKDDIVAVQLPNTVDAVVVLFAAARLGLIVTPVVMQYREHELGYILAQTTPRVFVTVATFAGHDHAAMAARLAASVPGMHVVTDIAARATAADPATVAPYIAAHPTDAAEVLTICWTSGTESRPKGVPRDHNHWLLNARVVAEATGMVAGDVLLNPFPLVNIGSIGGLVMPWLLLGGRLILHHPFDLGIFLGQIAAESVTYTIAPPAVLTALLDQPGLISGGAIASLRAIGSGSAPLSPWLIDGWLTRHAIQICNIFGSNEGASLFSSHVDVPDTTARARYFPRYGAEGIKWPGLTPSVMRTRLADPATGATITTPGQPGELRIGGGNVFAGYWRAPELTAAAFDEHDDFRTGDLFEIAGDGPLARFYRFVGRSKEIIVRGGVNISPAELDDLLVGMPLLAEAATVGIPDDRLGERVAVAVVPKGADVPDLAEVVAWMARAHDVAVFKRPERLVVVDRLPRNAMNKVVRNDLRALVLARL
jgi:cyclohexanecarboxylate-CoA ligase